MRARRALLALVSSVLSAGCVYLPPTGLLFSIEDPLSEAHELHVEVYDDASGRLLSTEVRVVRPRGVMPRARCLSVVPNEPFEAGVSVPVRVRLRTVRRAADGVGEVTSSATVRSTMRQGERRLVRVPLTAECGRTQSSACLARPAGETRCGDELRCRCGSAGCLDETRTCAAADLAHPEVVACSVEPRVDDGVPAGDSIDEDGCLSAR